METPSEIISFLESIPEEKRSVVLPSGKTIKETVFHLADWKTEVTDAYIKYFKEGIEPWFVKEKDPSNFNKKLDLQYKDKCYKEAVELLKDAYEERTLFINKFGKEKLLESGLDWMSEDIAEPHDTEHLKQIKKALAGKL